MFGIIRWGEDPAAPQAIWICRPINIKLILQFQICTQLIVWIGALYPAWGEGIAIHHVQTRTCQRIGLKYPEGESSESPTPKVLSLMDVIKSLPLLPHKGTENNLLGKWGKEEARGRLDALNKALHRSPSFPPHLISTHKRGQSIHLKSHLKGSSQEQGSAPLGGSEKR